MIAACIAAPATPSRAAPSPAPAPAAASDVKVLTPPPPPVTTTVTAHLDTVPDLARFLGRPISAVEVAIDGEPWGNVILPRVTAVRAGEPMTAAAARRALDDVLATGRFARARVVATDEGLGVRLLLKVVPRKIIDTLRVEMHGARIDREELLREGDFAEGDELVGADLADKQDRMEAFLARRGYADATVTIGTELTGDPIRVRLVLDVDPHEPRILARRVFYVSGADGKNLASTNETYRVRPGDRADETQLETADSQLEAKLRAVGYHRADVTHDVVLQSDPRGQPSRVVLRVRIDAGHLFRARFEGNDSYDGDSLEAALELDTESDLSGPHLVDKVRDFYRKHGFLDAEVTLEERGDAAVTHYLVFHVIEHRQVRVTGRAYPCLKEEDIRGLSEGGPGSVSKIGSEIDSFLEEELPGADLFAPPNPAGVDALLGPPPMQMTQGVRAVPLDLDPNATYVADTYERAAAHVQELYRNEGFLHAQIGPVQMIRRRCDPHSPPGRCVPVPLPPSPPEVCAYDATNLPLPAAPLDPTFTCVSDGARGVECEPQIALKIPMKLGPRTALYDAIFTGARSLPQPRILRAAALDLGDPVNTLKIEEARRRIVDLYKEEGYAYVDVKFSVDESLDHTRARVRFEVTEGEQVIVRDIVLQGNDITRASVIRRRIALEVGKPYRTSDVRKTQERIATLNVFSSVGVSLADPYVPQKYKTVVVTVSEVLPKYIEIRPGFSTGEGFRLVTEFGDRNIFGTAIGLSTRLQISYLPDALILDDQVKQNFRALDKEDPVRRFAGRATVRADFPEVGLGPLVRMGVDGIYARTLNRDFVLTKRAGVPTLLYQPTRAIRFSLSPTVEWNTVHLFQADQLESAAQATDRQRRYDAYQREGVTRCDLLPQGSLDDYLARLSCGGASADLARLLRVPEKTSNVYAQRFAVTWDRRDDPFNVHKGTYFASGVEHVDWFRPDDTNPLSGHFLRFTETFAGYIPIGKKITLAAEVRIGTNVQLFSNSSTYPDRFFFMGGFDSMRGWLQDSFIPQDYVDRIAADASKPEGTAKVTDKNIPIRGGNLMINPKLELRIPVTSLVGLALFADVGNLWADATYPFNTGKFPLRAAVGPGIRIQTPIGPLAFDLGFNVTRQSYEDQVAFNFAIGVF